MIKISEKSLEFVRKHFNNAEELLNTGDPNDVLCAIDDLILERGFSDDFEYYNNFGDEAQKIYDDIYFTALQEMQDD